MLGQLVERLDLRTYHLIHPSGLGLVCATRRNLLKRSQETIQWLQRPLLV